MKYVTKLAVVLSFAVAAPAFGAGKASEFLDIVNPLTIKKSFDDKHYGYTAAKAGVITAAVAAVGTGLWALNKYVPAFNKHVTQNVKAAAKGYVTRMRNVDVPTWMLTAAVLGLAASGVKFYRDHKALEAAKAVPTRDAFFAGLAAGEREANLRGRNLADLEKAVTDTAKALADNKDDTKKADLERDAQAAKDALDAVNASHAAAYAQLAANPGAKAAHVTRINQALINALRNEDAIAAFKA